MLAGVPRIDRYGHCTAVTSIATQTGLDVVVSGSAGGFVNVARMRSGKLVFALRPPPPAAIASADVSEVSSSVGSVLISANGVITIYCTWRHMKRRYGVLYSYSVNGKLLASDENCGTLSSLLLSSTGNTLIVCKRKGVVGLRDPESLQTRSKINTNSIPILTAQLTSNDSHLLLGLADGKLIVVPTTLP
jgi:WD40 repeat protein